MGTNNPFTFIHSFINSLFLGAGEPQPDPHQAEGQRRAGPHQRDSADHVHRGRGRGEGRDHCQTGRRRGLADA